jgi:hypothetical protein
VWCIDRTTANRSAAAAIFGNSSVNRRPGTRVGMVPNGPRTLLGASGFGSQVSSWLGPPTSMRKMQFTSFDWANAGPAARPATVVADVRRKSRRLIGMERGLDG